MMNQDGRRLMEVVLGIVIGDCMYREWKEICDCMYREWKKIEL